MGDRGNIFIRSDGKAEDPSGVYLYTHWYGTELPETLRAALARQARWDDGPYLARVIFDEMTKSSHGEETGHGIATYVCDNEYPILVVDPHANTVGLAPQRGSQYPVAPPVTLTFAEYAALPSPLDWKSLQVALKAAK